MENGKEVLGKRKNEPKQVKIPKELKKLSNFVDAINERKNEIIEDELFPDFYTPLKISEIISSNTKNIVRCNNTCIANIEAPILSINEKNCLKTCLGKILQLQLFVEDAEKEIIDKRYF